MDYSYVYIPYRVLVYIITNELMFIYSFEFHINVKYFILIVNITIILFSITISNKSLRLINLIAIYYCKYTLRVSFFSLLSIIGNAEIVRNIDTRLPLVENILPLPLSRWDLIIGRLSSDSLAMAATDDTLTVSGVQMGIILIVHGGT
jgi:hypothetical protein